MRRLVFLALCAVAFVAWLVADVLEIAERKLTGLGLRAAGAAKRFR